MNKRILRAFGFLLLLFPLVSRAEGPLIQPPQQPATGPGGARYSQAAVIKSVYGEGADQYWIFEPADPTPESAPVIVFNHGWGATNPKTYGAWIEHIVRRGNIVIYPVYQEPGKWRYPTRQITPNAIRAVKNAIDRLQREGKIKPELDKFAIVGHSAGGQITANMAALAGSVGLPEPGAIMCVQPGKSWSKSKKAAIPLEDLSTIPESTLLLTVVGDRDNIARDIDAKRIFNETSQIPFANKDFVIVGSDDYGKPALIANHLAPVAPDENYDSGEKRESRKSDGRVRSRLRERLKARIRERRESGNNDFPDLKNSSRSINALDYYGFWKLFDGLYEAAFYSRNREYALGNTPRQRFMGKWSDGTPVKVLRVTDNP
ncbi:MAG: alpha/beta hydrolase [Nitrospirae bacterium]|nr:alpha/beta hydrolase [Nitrospirota bacterium]